MEQPSIRNKFINTCFEKVFTEFNLSDEILEELYQDVNNPCREINSALKTLRNSKDAQKCFIICEFTNEREPVKYLAKLLRKYDQGSIAEDLERFNHSEQLMEYVTHEFLPVRHSPVLRSGGSCRFEMESSPRGLCLILLNEIELEPEAKQLTSVFTQMYFMVKVEAKKTCKQIDEIFEEVANSEKYQGYNALVTILIGHGSDGLFYGSTAERNPKDNVAITHLIDKFAEEKCSNFSGKPKVNIFNCCRNRSTDKLFDLSRVSSTLLEKITTFNQSWINTNINTTVIYSCAEGQGASYSSEGFSSFGRALSHTLAQYACEQSLDQLIKTVNRRLDNDDVKQYTEVIHYKSRWALYFNPGRIRIV